MNKGRIEHRRDDGCMTSPSSSQAQRYVSACLCWRVSRNDRFGDPSERRAIRTDCISAARSLLDQTNYQARFLRQLASARANKQSRKLVKHIKPNFDEPLKVGSIDSNIFARSNLDAICLGDEAFVHTLQARNSSRREGSGS